MERSLTRKKGVKDPMIIDYDKNDLNDHMRQLEDMKAPPWSYGGGQSRRGHKRGGGGGGHYRAGS